MVGKRMLPSRLDKDLVERLQAEARACNITVNDLIWNALEALERERKVAETVEERLDCLEQNLALLIDGTQTNSEKLRQLFAEASVNEKERLKSLLQLLKNEMQAHDQSEQERFERMKRQPF